MLRTVFFLVFAFIFFGCCYHGSITKYGWPRKIVKTPDSITNLDVYQKIDTTLVYERLKTIHKGIGAFNVDTTDRRVFLRFYSNGKVSVFPQVNFVAPKGDYSRRAYQQDLSPNEITKDDFIPENSIMGHYYTKNGEIQVKSLHMNQCNAVVVNSKITVIGDTLIQSFSNSLFVGYTTKYIYVKRKIPKLYLEGWQPDW